MNIVIIGSGNVATHMGVALFQANNNILQVYSRQRENAIALANTINAQAITDLNAIDQEADLYIVSLKDDVLEDVIDLMPLLNGIVVHTAGSVPLSVLSRFDKYGVFYPFQTFTKSAELIFRHVPILVESNDDEVFEKLWRLANSLSDTVLKANSKQRGHLHIAAVYACNFVNHMYRLADEVLKESELPFELLHPLIAETAAKVQKMAPEAAQTGPAIRNDQKIMDKHIDILEGNDEWQGIYKALSESIIKRL